MKTRYLTMASTLVGAVLVVQAAHMVEHVAQVIQKFGLHQQEAHGLLGHLFDFEWVHFAFNSSLEAALITAAVGWWRGGATIPVSLRMLVALQGYHVSEHVVKMIQYYGMAGSPKGILGAFVPVIWLHFTLNLVVLVMIGAAWGAIRAPRGTGRALAPALAREQH